MIRPHQSLSAALIISLILVWAAALVLPAQASQEEEERIRAIERASKSVVSVRTYRQNRDKPGIGSGIIINANGYIVTNAHVVKGGKTVKVQLKNKKTYNAKIWKMAPEQDLAILKINGRGLPTASIGSSSSLRVGQTVIAIGDPLGFTGTVTVGMVSGLGRNIETKGIRYKNLIQTDAAINPGSSGGALVNLNGSVVGINALVYTGPASGYDKAQGLGFAIPISTAIQVADQLISSAPDPVASSGRGSSAASSGGRPWLGLSGETLTLEKARDFDIKITSGVFVTSVVDGSPADSARLRAGDTISGVNGTTVTTVGAMLKQLNRFHAGDTIKLIVWRNNKKFLVSVTLEGQ